MNTISELIDKVKNIYDELCSIKENEKKGHNGFDFETLAKNKLIKPIKNHIITKQSDFIKKVYLIVLGCLINETDDGRIREKQIFHFGGIAMAADLKDVSINELLSKSHVIDEKVLIDLSENFNGDLLDIFIIDCLILANISGKQEDREMSLLGNILSLFDISKDKFKTLCVCAKNILICDDMAVLKVKEVNTPFLIGYLNAKIEGIIVNNWEEAKNSKEPIYIFYKEFKHIDEQIILDKYGKEFYFYNCVFDDIGGFLSIKSKVHFIGCEFKNCTSNTHIIAMSDGKIENCRFIRCNGEDLTSRTGLFLFKQVDVINTVFENCSVKTKDKNYSFYYNRNTQSTYINLVLMTKSQMYNCKFLSCNVEITDFSGNIDHYIYIVTAINSIVKNNEFIDCGFLKEDYTDFSLYNINLYNSEENNNNFIYSEFEDADEYDNIHNNTVYGNNKQVIDWDFGTISKSS